jgi:hypothetical protein
MQMSYDLELDLVDLENIGSLLLYSIDQDVYDLIISTDRLEFIGKKSEGIAISDEYFDQSMYIGTACYRLAMYIFCCFHCIGRRAYPSGL